MVPPGADLRCIFWRNLCRSKDISFICYRFFLKFLQNVYKKIGLELQVLLESLDKQLHLPTMGKK